MSVQSISFASNPPRQLHVLGHDCLSLCVQGAEVCVFEQVYRVVLKDLLQEEDRFVRPIARKESIALQYFLANNSGVENTFVGCQCV
jgi:hypothetical protein